MNHRTEFIESIKLAKRDKSDQVLNPISNRYIKIDGPSFRTLCRKLNVFREDIDDTKPSTEPGHGPTDDVKLDSNFTDVKLDSNFTETKKIPHYKIDEKTKQHEINGEYLDSLIVKLNKEIHKKNPDRYEVIQLCNNIIRTIPD